MNEHVTQRRKTLIFSVLVVVVFLFSFYSPLVVGAAVDPILVDGNPTCQELGYLYGFKIDGNPDNGTYTLTSGTQYGIDTVLSGGAPEDPNNSVTISNNTDGLYFDWSSTLGIDGVIVKGGPDANHYEYPSESTGDSGLHAPMKNGQPFELSHVSFCYDYEGNLAISKTANPLFTRTYQWEIEKTVSPDPLRLFAGESGNASYSVTATKTGYVDSNWSVNGTITIENNAPVAATIENVSDSVEGVDAEVNCAVDFPYTLESGDTLTCDYSAELPDGSTRINTATVTTSGVVEGGQATAQVLFSSPSTEINDAIDVTDSNGSSWSTSSTTTWKYDKNYTCPTLPQDYSNGTYSNGYQNTATIDQTGTSAQTNLSLVCYAPIVTKDASTEWFRDVTWNITKSVTPDSFNLRAGESDTARYTVEVEKIVNDHGYKAFGTITVQNPHPSEVMTVTISDQVDQETATLDCGGELSVPAADTSTCGYTVELSDATDRTNTATATLNGIGFSASAPVTFGTPIVRGYQSIEVVDTNGSSWVAQDDSSWEYTKDFTCGEDPSLYSNGTYSETYDNTATIQETGQQSGASVDLGCRLPGNIVIQKETEGGNGSFNFTSPELGSFTIATSNGSGNRSFGSLEAGSYEVTESLSSNSLWNFTDLSCTDPDRGTSTSGTTASIDLDYGETVSCTFTNTRKTGEITFVKEVEDGTADPSEWTFEVEGPQQVSGIAHNQTVELDTGNYTVREEGPTGYNLVDASGVCSLNDGVISLSVEEGGVCTITNAEKTGQLEIVKDVVPNDNSEWTLTYDGPTTGTKTGSGDFRLESTSVPVGTYTVSESGSDGSLYTSSYACTGASTNPSGSGNTFNVTVAEDETVTCTFTNQRKSRNLTVVKELSPTDDDGTFLMHADGTTGGKAGNGASVTTSVYVGATADFSESGVDGTELDNYLTTYSCNDPASTSGNTISGSLTMPDQDVTCTFTNTRKTNTVILNKELYPSDEGSFNLLVNGIAVATGVGSGGSGNATNIPVGSTVNISETGNETDLSSYNSTLDCSGADLISNNGTAGSFIMPDNSVSCTFVNTYKEIQQPIIDVEKYTNDLDSDQAPGPYLKAGSTVIWSYDIKNMGNTSLTNITLIDDQEGSIDCPQNDLEPGQSMTCSATGTVELGPYANEATVTGSPPDEGPSVSDNDPSHYTGVDARIRLDPPSATNEVTEPHTITATVEMHDGTSWKPAGGANVTFTLENNGAGASFVAGNTATTSTNGQGSIDINSSLTGSVEIHAETSVNVQGLTLTRETDGLGGNTPNASKTYVDAVLTLTPSIATNQVGQEHILTATLLIDYGNGAGFGPVSGEEINFSLLNGAGSLLGSTSVFTDDAGQAQVTINSDTVGSNTVQASWSGSIAQALLTRTDSAEKDYVDNPIITIQKRTIPAGSQVSFNFAGDLGSFVLNGDGSSISFTPGPGTYNIREILPQEWEISEIIIEDPDGESSASDTTANVDLDSGETVTVIFENESKSADISLVKTVDNTAPAEGDELVYTIEVTNSGPDPATGVEVTDLLPEGLTYVTHAETAGIFDELLGIWDIGDMAVGITEQLTITVTVDEGTADSTITNTGEVTESDLPDPDSTPDNDDPNEDDQDDASITVASQVGGGAAGEVEDPCAGRVIINEVAWAGTPSSPLDEWIELRNLSNEEIDLDGWKLQWKPKQPTSEDDDEWKVLNLVGTLAPSDPSPCEANAEESDYSPGFTTVTRNDATSWWILWDLQERDRSYFTLERRYERTISNEEADLLYDTVEPYQYELSDKGEVIQLLNPRDEVVDTANSVRLESGGWPAGEINTRATMERTDPLGPDTPDNWHTNLGIVTHGLDSEGVPLLASATRQNSRLFEDLLLSGRISVLEATQNDPLKASVRLPSGYLREFDRPMVRVIHAGQKPSNLAAGGAGSFDPQGSDGISISPLSGNTYDLNIDTSNLEPGSYAFWVPYGQGKAVLVAVRITE